MHEKMDFEVCVEKETNTLSLDYTLMDATW